MANAYLIGSGLNVDVANLYPVSGSTVDVTCVLD